MIDSLMDDFFRHLCSGHGFVPRAQCGQWTLPLILLHTISDTAVGCVYFTIPALLIYWARRQPRHPHSALLGWFAAFIATCGLTHFADVAVYWWPAYRLFGLVKLLTAVVSWITALLLAPAIPDLLRLARLWKNDHGDTVEDAT